MGCRPFVRYQIVILSDIVSRQRQTILIDRLPIGSLTHIESVYRDRSEHRERVCDYSPVLLCGRSSGNNVPNEVRTCMSDTNWEL